MPPRIVLIVLVLLNALPQAREVLYALDKIKSGTSAQLTHLTHLLFIFSAQMILLIAMWYGTPLLCTIDVVKTIPALTKTHR